MRNCFVETTVTAAGQPVGLIVAETAEIARKAAVLCKILYVAETSEFSCPIWKCREQEALKKKHKGLHLPTMLMKFLQWPFQSMMLLPVGDCTRRDIALSMEIRMRCSREVTWSRFLERCVSVDRSTFILSVTQLWRFLGKEVGKWLFLRQLRQLQKHISLLRRYVASQNRVSWSV